MTNPIISLGIESSCDDTAAAIVQFSENGAKVLSNVVVGQNHLHKDFGGVVPEIAARAHAELIDICVENALMEAGTDLSDVDVISVTSGPGLIGGVVAGVMCAKGIAATTGKPIIGVNHLAGHALTPHLTDQLPFPYLMLLASGGHCQFLIVEGPDKFQRLGGTIDDAPGEAFDKTARVLGLAQPGGPAVEREAKEGDSKRFNLPRPLLDRPDMNLSFSGLKTALIRARDSVMTDDKLADQDRKDLCASFQSAVVDILTRKTKRAISAYLELEPKYPAISVAGGVAANSALRSSLEALASDHGLTFSAPPLSLCTDNAAMIAFAGGRLFLDGRKDDLTFSARPRWPLDQTQPSMVGSGKKGAKA